MSVAPAAITHHFNMPISLRVCLFSVAVKNMDKLDVRRWQKYVPSLVALVLPQPRLGVPLSA